LNLLRLLHLCDSLFPIGSFAHSDGLEAAVASGALETADDLAGWLAVCLDETIARLEGPAMLAAWVAFGQGALAELVRIDRELTSLKPAGTLRRGGRAMGSRLLKAWHSAYPDEGVSRVLALAGEHGGGPALPVAFGCACRSAGVDERSAAEAFAYTRLASSVSAAMRLMAIGQAEAHRRLAQALARVPAEVANMIARGDKPRSFAPAMDLAAMAQPYLHSRLFLS
jgi:urease accessory protein